MVIDTTLKVLLIIVLLPGSLVAAMMMLLLLLDSYGIAREAWRNRNHDPR